MPPISAAVLPECRFFYPCPHLGGVASLSSYPTVIAKSYPIRTVIQLLDVEKQKEPITQSTRNRREHNSRFKVMFYVIGSENSKSGSAFYSSRQQNQRPGGAVRHFRCTDTVSGRPDISQYGRTFLFGCYVAAYRCAIIIQIMCYAVKVTKPSHYIRNFKRQISTVAENFSLPVRTFSREMSTGKK